jgi:hypothetical protein
MTKGDHLVLQELIVAGRCRAPTTGVLGVSPQLHAKRLVPFAFSCDVASE